VPFGRIKGFGSPFPLAGFSISPSISRNGRFVAFVSNAPNHTDDDPDRIADIFVFDLRGARAPLTRLSREQRHMIASR
jgi:hypothetical protein